MGIFKEIRIRGMVEIHSDKTTYGEGVYLRSIKSLTVYDTNLSNFSIPEPNSRELVHRISPANTFCSETIGEYPSFLADSKIEKALRNNHFLACVSKNSITIFMSNFNDEGPVRLFLEKARFRLHKDSTLVLS